MAYNTSNEQIGGTPSIEISNAQLNDKSYPMFRLIDLNNDCLEHIFLYLSMKQLFAVAQSNGQLSDSCRRVFYRKFRHREINISVHHLEYKQFPRILNIFGDIIQYVRITYEEYTLDRISSQLIHQSIGKYCAETLTELTINNIEPTMAITSVFANVQKLSFNQGCIGQLHIKRCFPKIQCLQFFFSEMMYPECIEQVFPTLEDLTVAHNSFSVENLKTFLKQNPQLKKFCVYNSNRQVISALEEFTKAHFEQLSRQFEIYPCYFAFKNRRGAGVSCDLDNEKGEEKR